MSEDKKKKEEIESERDIFKPETKAFKFPIVEDEEKPKVRTYIDEMRANIAKIFLFSKKRGSFLHFFGFSLGKVLKMYYLCSKIHRQLSITHYPQ